MSRLKAFFSKYREEFMGHISEEVLAIYHREQQVTLEEYYNLRMNSYERRLLADKLDTNALLSVIQNCINNSSFREIGKFECGTTYDEVLIGLYLPLLVKWVKEHKS